MQALLIIDMQRWMFRTPDRAAQLASFVPKINGLTRGFAAAGLPVFNVGTFHKADRSTWSRLMLKHDYACMIEGTKDIEPVDGLDVPASSQLIAKTANNAFLGTDLDDRLCALNVEKVVHCGVFIDGCVGLTAAEAEQRGYASVLVEDAIGHVDAAHGATIFEWLDSMYELPVIRTSDVDLS